MTAATLVLASGLAFLTSGGLAAAGAFVAFRTQRQTGSFAPSFFAIFWWAAAGIVGSGAIRSALAAAGLDTFANVSALESATTPLYCIAAACLVIYVVHLHTGRTTHALPVAVYYMLMIPVLRYPVLLAHPIGYEVTPWQLNYVYDQPLQGPTLTLAVLAVLGPLLAALAAYATLAFRVHDAATRYRILCITLGLGLWVGTEALAFTTGAAGSAAGEIGRRLVALAATGVVLAAYAPPAFVRRRLDTHAVQPLGADA